MRLTISGLLGFEWDVLGMTHADRRLFVSFTVRRNRVRIISARPMSRRERLVYEAKKKQRV